MTMIYPLYRYFAETVPQARALFAEAANEAGVTVRTWEHPLPGPMGEMLALDACYLGPPDAENVLMITSGTHGVEGHTGSGIQVGVLRHLREMNFAPAIGVLLVHLVNPWGCAWSRRENEDNVDIFRDLIYLTPPYPDNPLYDQFEEGLNPRTWHGPERARADAIWDAFAAEYGMDVVTATIRRGTHKHAKGLTYNGQGPTWSRRTVEAVADAFLLSAKRIGVCDIHTGFGDFGGLLVCSHNARDSKSFQTVGRWLEADVYETGNHPLIPTHPAMPYEHLGPRVGAEVIVAALEYGTHDVAGAFDIFRANTFIHTYGDPLSEFASRVAAEYRELFYPRSATWRSTVLTNGMQMAARIGAGVAAWR